MEVKENKVSVNLQQFAVDTLFVCKTNGQNFLVIKSILGCFKMTSRLRVNLHKIKFWALSVDKNDLMSYSRILNCNTMEVPFKYLSMVVRGNPIKQPIWQPKKALKNVLLTKSILGKVYIYLLKEKYA